MENLELLITEEIDRMILTPLDWSDEQMAQYVAESSEFDAGEAALGYVERLLRSIELGEVVIERRKFGFAIIHRVFKVAPKIRPKIKVLSHFHVEAITVFRGCATRDESTQFFNELIEKYGAEGDLHGQCFGRARAKLFTLRGCDCEERPSEPGWYDVVLQKRAESKPYSEFSA